MLYVVDVEAAAPFYRDVLGFEFQGFAERDGESYYAEMVADRVKFALHEPMSPRQEAKIGQQRVYFRVNDLEELTLREASSLIDELKCNGAGRRAGGDR